LRTPGRAVASRRWFEVSAALQGARLPVALLIGEREVEREPILSPALSRFLPQAAFIVVPGAGRLLPLGALEVTASTCMRMISMLQINA
jgi:hypothetical protein